MADFNENQNGVFGGIQFNDTNKQVENTSYFEGKFESENTGNNKWGGQWNSTENNNNGSIWGNTQNTNQNAEGFGNPIKYDTIKKEKAMTERGLWSRIKAFLFQEIDLTAPIKVELTPYQQKVEDEINAFLHQEVTFKGIANFFKKNK